MAEQQIAQLAAQVQQLTAELQRVQQQQQQQQQAANGPPMGAFAEAAMAAATAAATEAVRQALGQQREAGGGRPALAIDARQLGKPPVFNGDEKEWRDWVMVFRSYAVVAYETLGEAMTQAEVETADPE